MLAFLRTLTAAWVPVALIFFCASARAEEKPVYLFILSGQSNMAGMKPEAGFMPEAAKLFPDGEVVYAKVAIGGQPIRYWVPSYIEIAGKSGVNAAQFDEKDKARHGAYYKRILE